MRVLESWARPVAASVALAVGLAAVAWPAGAAQGAKPQAGDSRLRASAEARVAADVASATLSAQAASAPAAAEGSRSFFKTRKGVVVLVLLGGTIVWTAVSRNKDAIHSPGRQ